MTKAIIDNRGEPQLAVRAEVLQIDAKGDMATVQLIEGDKKGFYRTVYLDEVHELGEPVDGHPTMGSRTKEPIVEGCMLLACIRDEDLLLGKSILIPSGHELAQA